MKQLWLDQAIRNLTCDDLEIPLVVIGLGITELKKAVVLHLLGFFRGGGRSASVISCVCSTLG